MRRLKIMLSAIAFLAVAGGALAYKTKNVGLFGYCITTDLNCSARCCVSLINASFLPGAQMKYILTANPASCPSACPACTQIGAPVL